MTTKMTSWMLRIQIAWLKFKVNVKILMKLPAIIMSLDRRITKLDAELQAFSDMMMNDVTDVTYKGAVKNVTDLLNSTSEPKDAA